MPLANSSLDHSGHNRLIHPQDGNDGIPGHPVPEILVDPISGQMKQVFAGQRWLAVIQQDAEAAYDLTAHHSRSEAQTRLNNALILLTKHDQTMPLVSYVVEARIMPPTRRPKLWVRQHRRRR